MIWFYLAFISKLLYFVLYCTLCCVFVHFYFNPAFGLQLSLIKLSWVEVMSTGCWSMCRSTLTCRTWRSTSARGWRWWWLQRRRVSTSVLRDWRRSASSREHIVWSPDSWSFSVSSTSTSSGPTRSSSTRRRPVAGPVLIGWATLELWTSTTTGTATSPDCRCPPHGSSSDRCCPIPSCSHTPCSCWRRADQLRQSTTRRRLVTVDGSIRCEFSVDTKKRQLF